MRAAPRCRASRRWTSRRFACRTVHYGNIGAADRLDFTVIRPAVNLVSRIENAAKMLGQPIVVSAELAAALDGVVSLGRHQLRDLAAPQELFAPD